MNWKEKIPNHVLSVMRYVYLDKDKNFPIDIDDEEWSGKLTKGERDTGVKDYIISLVHAEMQRAFFAGFKDGAKKTFDDLVTLIPKEIYTGLTFSEEENLGGAWKGWEEWLDKEKE